MLPSKHLLNLQAAAERTFLDLCILQVRTAGASNDYGYAEDTITDDTAYTPCGFGYLRTGESTYTAYEAPEADAMLRLTRDTSVTNVDRVKVTHIQGNKLATPLVFDVIGEPKLQRTGVTLLLKAANEL